MSYDKRSAGRPLKFQSVAELEQKIEAYFANCDPHIGKQLVKMIGADGKVTWIPEEVVTEQEPYTITGLALSLDTTRETLLDYQHRDDAFSDAIKRAKLRVQNYLEKSLARQQGSVVGLIFNLKNNHGWVDEQKVNNEHSGHIDLSAKTEEELDAVIAKFAGKATAGGSNPRKKPPKS